MIDTDCTNQQKSWDSYTFVVLNDVEYYDVVPKKYRFNPQVEDMVYGDELVDGMVVLVQTDLRTDDEDDDCSAERLLITNRWCEVTKVRAGQSGIYFIGLYVDGQKEVRHSTCTTGWLVKQETMPKPVEVDED